MYYKATGIKKLHRGVKTVPANCSILSNLSVDTAMTIPNVQIKILMKISLFLSTSGSFVEIICFTDGMSAIISEQKMVLERKVKI